MALHPLLVWQDAIAALPIPTTSRAVLWGLVRFGRWETGDNCAPSVARIVEWTGLSERTVQYTLRRLLCTGCSQPDCPHYGLLVETHAAERYAPATYRLSEKVLGTQGKLPEVGPRSKAGDIYDGVRQKAADPYAAVVKRDWPATG